jgi:hypothetical protein
MILAAIVVAAIGSLMSAPSQARAVAPFTTGIVQDQWPAAPWWDSAIHSLGATYARFELPWAAAEPTRPAAGSNPSDPANPAFQWQQYIDAQVRAAHAAGLRVILVVDQAPKWAEGPGMPSYVWPGTWRPDPQAFGAFARAVARRYSGSYPDPLHPGASLPAVQDWIAWNEPNEPSEITPQWVTVGGHVVPASPGIFRPLLNAFYAGVKSVSASNRVISGGLAPYGDPPGGARMQPMEFLRTLLCLDSSLGSACNSVADFDAIDIHPYSPKDPHWHARNADDVTVPDIYKMNRALAAGVRLHHVFPVQPKSVVVTEFSWDTSPPDPRGIPLLTQAHYLEDAFYVLWRQGVNTALWWRLTDQDPGSRGYATTYQSGVLFENGQPKPSAASFRFPFVAHRIGRKKVRAWGKVPAPGSLLIQRQRRHGWKTISTSSVGGNDVFQLNLSFRGSAVLRAVSGRLASLTWSVG